MTDRNGDVPSGITRNSAATITRILAGAEAEFGTKGLDGAKVDDIARAAGISKQLVYHYFNGKQDLYSEMLSNIARRNYELLVAIDYDSMKPIEAIRAFLKTLFDVYYADPFSATVTMDQGLHGGAQVRYNRRVELLREAFRAKLGNTLARGQASGELTERMDVANLHFLAVVMVTGCLSLRPMFMRYTGGKSEIDAGEDALWRDNVIEFFLRAMRPENAPACPPAGTGQGGR
jgi:AcrR family transcriptional regulator